MRQVAEVTTGANKFTVWSVDDTGKPCKEYWVTLKDKKELQDIYKHEFGSKKIVVKEGDFKGTKHPLDEQYGILEDER
jgi:hypothetical protein